MSLRRLTYYLLWLFVFTVPWDTLALPIVGSVSRLCGLAVIASAIIVTASAGHFRKPDAVLGCAIAFALWSALSLLWTVSYGITLLQATTYVQFVASVWVIREFVRTREDTDRILIAICLGLFIPLSDLLNNFRLGSAVGNLNSRFTGSGFNADQIALYLVLGLPIAWHLIMNGRNIVKIPAVIYFVAAPVGLLLTSTRGAVVAGVVSLAIVPFTLPRRSIKSYVFAGMLVILGGTAAVSVVPRANWDRITGIASEVTERRSMSGRREIWDAGLEAFPERPLFGSGLGTYGAVIEPILHRNIPAHNLILGLLVEEGFIGLGLFFAILAACVWTIIHAPPHHRALWSVIILTWLTGGLSGSPEAVKFTWVLFGLISAQSGMPKERDESAVEEPSREAVQSLRAAAIV